MSKSILKYKHISPDLLPTGESLKMTTQRVLPYFKEQIVPHLKAGSNVMISAHGNSLRAILKTLFDVPDKDIPGFEFPTGNPLLIDMKHGTLDITAAKIRVPNHPLKTHGDYMRRALELGAQQSGLTPPPRRNRCAPSRRPRRPRRNRLCHA